MPIHDYVIDNQTFPATRSDWNAVLAAIVSLNSNSTAPTTTYAYMPWVDTSGSPAVLKQRNATNTDWLTLFKIGKSGFIPQDGSSIFAADGEASDTYVITLDPAPAALTTGMLVGFSANTINSGACTLNVNSLGAKSIKKKFNVDLVDGDIKAGQLVIVSYDGTNFQMLSAANTVTTPTDFSVINDTNSNESIEIAATASAINHLKSINAATGNSPTLSAVGDNTDIDLLLDGKGIGGVKPQCFVGSKTFTLTPGATVPTNAALGNEARLLAGQNFTLSNPTNPTDGQKMLWRIKQGGSGSYTITLGSAFRLGTDITTITLSTAIGDVDYLGCVYNSTDTKWDVILFVTGY